ncbi:MAG: UDP-N-acetylglucosamine 1-carboxyvinyltransferase [Lentisphaerae bacterium]|nr:UDP-N-acetylglucosamine 1-carboxyvinyltransferase [Lentisphaerota bacterium]
MARIIIQGGKRISGRHRAPGNKNAALPMLAASVLTDEPVRLTNVPLIEDVQTMLAILEGLGVSTTVRGHTVTLCARGMRKRRLDPLLCGKVRASVLFAGPMAARFGRVTLFPPGGDGIGSRSLETHFSALRRLGIVAHGQQHYVFRRGQLHGARILLEEASVSATENVLMAAVLAKGRTTIFNAACEPHVQDLCAMLKKMGARIRGAGTNYLVIHGVERLGGVQHRVAPDYIDMASYLAAAVVTQGQMTVENIPAEQLDVVGAPFHRLGVRWELENGKIVLPAEQRLRVHNSRGRAVPKIEDGPWPNVPSDLMSIAIVLATQAKGSVLFFEKMFESRMYFADRLVQMGARIVQCDPHRVLVTGPSSLRGMHISSPDIRAGMALIIAALCAHGESVIDNAETIDRGYERVVPELRRLGADIRREP